MSPAGAPAAPPEIDGVFAALADPTRRLLLDLLAVRRPSSATTLAAEVTVSRQAVVQHLAVLERARLVAARRAGREVLFSVRPEPLLATASWMTHLAETWDERLRLLKQRAEAAERAENPGAGRGGDEAAVRGTGRHADGGDVRPGQGPG
ncbi:ArsR/SmtB family transcription factor [Actinacidiphila rubida]|uniref:DNA-binding transcriptional regulator, ArsR family n=1 Tax=Actinacidiphila rubida TaxID=310780 RepID=A0A1H8LMJ8_9ACTN|nr:metalloregulator ArsR/SmtB family transcription factor [Actinacidiphila rubida]SEO06233.1 DNA-binding transcriptional regulator, ArsR family [Actinacidiphila rubida]